MLAQSSILAANNAEDDIAALSTPYSASDGGSATSAQKATSSPVPPLHIPSASNTANDNNNNSMHETPLSPSATPATARNGPSFEERVCLSKNNVKCLDVLFCV